MHDFQCDVKAWRTLVTHIEVRRTMKFSERFSRSYIPCLRVLDDHQSLNSAISTYIRTQDSILNRKNERTPIACGAETCDENNGRDYANQIHIAPHKYENNFMFSFSRIIDKYKIIMRCVEFIVANFNIPAWQLISIAIIVLVY